MALRGTERFLCGVNSAPSLQAQPLLSPGPPQLSSPAPCLLSHRFLAPGEGGTGCTRCPRASRRGKPLGGSLMLGKIRISSQPPCSSGAWAHTVPCAECVRSQLQTSPGHAGVLKTQPQHCQGWAEPEQGGASPGGLSAPRLSDLGAGAPVGLRGWKLAPNGHQGIPEGCVWT